MNNIIRFPSRVTGAMRLPDPLDYPNEGGLPCDCEPRDSAAVIQLPIKRRASPLELWCGLMVLAWCGLWLAWAR